MSSPSHRPFVSEEDEPQEYYNEIEMPDGQTVLAVAKLSRGSRQFDVTFHMAEWQAPETIADYLEVYAALLAEKSVFVNNTESLEN